MDNIRQIAPAQKAHSENRKKILFLGYSEQKTCLISALTDAGCEVWHSEDEVSTLTGFDLIISYGYRHILKKTLLNRASPVINLHISYLPYNRGAHPNFWSFFDATPSGVTIHLVDEGIDTGDILLQRYVNFDKDITSFKDAYQSLHKEIEKLFIENIAYLISGKLTPYKQRGKGSYHNAKDLPSEFSGWDSDIKEEIKKLEQLSLAQISDKLALIDEIENVRKGNNVNWMDLLRLSFKVAPEESKAIIRRINSDDNRISELFKKLGE